MFCFISTQFSRSFFIFANLSHFYLNLYRQAIGAHFPLQNGTEVLIDCINGDPTQAYIMGAVSNAAQPSVTTCHNPYENLIRSHQGQTLLMDDTPTAPKLSLGTAHDENQLLMDATPQQHQLKIQSKKGSIHHRAQQNIEHQSDANIIHQIDGNHQHHSVQAQIQHSGGNLRTQADTLQQKAQGDIKTQTDGDHIEQAAGTHQLETIQDIAQLTHGKQHVSHSMQSSHLIQAGNQITIQGSGDAPLHIGQGKSGICLLPNGTVQLYGNSIALNGAVSKQGKTNFLPTVGQAHPWQAVDAVQLPEDIAQLTLGADGITAQNHQLTIQLNHKLPQKTNDLSSLNYRYQIKQIDFKASLSTSVTTWKIVSEGIISDGLIKISDVDLNQSMQIHLTESNQPTPQLSVHCIGIDQTACLPTNHIQIEADDAKCQNTVDTHNNQSKIERTVTLTILPASTHRDYRIGEAHSFAQCLQDHGYQLTDSDHQALQASESYYDIAQVNNNRFRTTLLSSKELAQLKAIGNVTIFIHGFNVPFGTFADQSENDDNQYDLYREEQQRNGDGAHNWWLNIENSLNQASGEFDGKDYSRYGRIIGIAWQGSPRSVNDYMADVQYAKYPALLATKLIEQLLEQKIEVNIIAHSLGNLVLMNILEQLGKQDKYTNGLNHVFMWEAAIPDNSFATEKPKDPIAAKYYYFPNAYKAMKKVTVLYSQHDNVLGAMGHSDSIVQKFEDQNAGFAIAITEAAIWETDKTILKNSNQATSLYNAANLMRYPLNEIITDCKQQQKLYPAFIKAYAQKAGERYVDINHNPIDIDLETQVSVLKHFYPKAFVSISKLMWLYLSNKLDWLWETPIAYTEAQFTIKKAELIDVINKNYEEMMGKQLEDGSYKPSQEWCPIHERVACFVMTAFLCPHVEPRGAMGYHGADKNTILHILKNKYIDGNQKDWLKSHSDMHYPSADMMKHVYERYIIGGEGLHTFGRYKKLASKK